MPHTFEDLPPPSRPLPPRLAAAFAALLTLLPIPWLAPCLAAAPPAVHTPAAGAEELLTVAPAEAGRRGGRLVVALPAEPRTFNPVVMVDNPSRTVVERTTADLVHIDRLTQLPEPALARTVEVSDDGRRFRLELRRGLRFSDGEPLTAADVVFTFEVYLDPRVASPHRDLLIVDGEPITVRQLGEYTVEVEMTAPYAVGERLFDGIAVLPRHLLAEAHAAGRLAEAWGLATPPAQMAGLGPFRLRRYLPGERLELERNPHYWKRDAAGVRLPYLDELTFLFVADQEAQALRFAAGETQLIDRLDAESFAALAAAKEHDRYVLRDLGPGLAYEFLFFNLNDLDGRDLPALARKQAWLGELAFRRAVSQAIDRPGIVRLVYGGRATPIASHVTPANRAWAHPGLRPPAYDPEGARRTLADAGFTWDGAGRLRDPAGTMVELSLMTNAGNARRLDTVTVLQEDLRRLGIAVRAVPLEFRALLDRVFGTFDYEGCVLGLGGGDVDPNPSLNVWLSSGSSHLWRLGQETPATPWEAEIDRLMTAQLTARDPAARKRLYDRVQELAAEHLPLIFLVSPNVLVGADAGLGNFAPAVLDHPTLWNVEELFWRHDTSPARR